LREAERKRLVYVAATRARDILVVPKVGAPDPRKIFSGLLGSTSSPALWEQELHTPQRHAPWFDAAAPGIAVLPKAVSDRDLALARTWRDRAVEASHRHLPPSAFTQASTPRLFWGRKGRFGTVFGETVHLAIGFALQASMSVDDAVKRAAVRTSLTAHRREATEDVARALTTLRSLGVSTGGAPYRLEYPIAGLAAGGDLVAGYADLVAELAGGLLLLDFKTDAPLETEDQMPQTYIDQVRGYAGVLAQVLGTGPIRAGVLFTANGGIHWLSSGDHAHRERP
jgi:ATP-dependent helicase/nuclease subunit A